MRRLIGWLIFLALAWGVFALAEGLWGDADKWGLPATGECGERQSHDDGTEDHLVVIDCDDPRANYRVIRRFDDTTDVNVCATEPTATVVFQYDGDLNDDGDEAVLCLTEMD